MQWLTSICITLTLASLTHTASAGVVIGGTRVIYDTARKDSSFSVSNTGTSEPYLIQSWVENLHDSNKAPFIITPPLFRLDADQENTLRIIHTGGQLPADKESAFWVNVKTISASEKSDSNQLQISVKSRIKVFYRPTGLPGDATEAYKALTFTRQGRQLKVNNPTPYHVSFFTSAWEIKKYKMPVWLPHKKRSAGRFLPTRPDLSAGKPSTIMAEFPPPQVPHCSSQVLCILYCPGHPKLHTAKR